MSLANVFFQQIASHQTAEFKSNLIEDFVFWKDPNAPLCNMGVLLKEEEKKKFVEDVKERVQQLWNSEDSDIESLFWLCYIAELLELRLEVNTREKKLAKFFLNKCANEAYYDIEGYISAIRLI